jgi:hypothetical protein
MQVFNPIFAELVPDFTQICSPDLAASFNAINKHTNLNPRMYSLSLPYYAIKDQ